MASSFWLVDNLVQLGRHAEAGQLFDRVRGVANDVGLLAEEYDPVAGRQVGNFPRVFSHIALVNSSWNLGAIRGSVTDDRCHEADELGAAWLPGADRPDA